MDVQKNPFSILGGEQGKKKKKKKEQRVNNEETGEKHWLEKKHWVVYHDSENTMEDSALNTDEFVVVSKVQRGTVKGDHKKSRSDVNNEESDTNKLVKKEERKQKQLLEEQETNKVKATSEAEEEVEFVENKGLNGVVEEEKSRELNKEKLEKNKLKKKKRKQNQLLKKRERNRVMAVAKAEERQEEEEVESSPSTLQCLCKVMQKVLTALGLTTLGAVLYGRWNS